MKKKSQSFIPGKGNRKAPDESLKSGGGEIYHGFTRSQDIIPTKMCLWVSPPEIPFEYQSKTRGLLAQYQQKWKLFPTLPYVLDKWREMGGTALIGT